MDEDKALMAFTDEELWFRDGLQFDWAMPRASWWKRLPVIRHVRATRYGLKVDRHNRFHRMAGKIPTGYDEWVLWGIAHGKERPY